MARKLPLVLIATAIIAGGAYIALGSSSSTSQQATPVTPSVPVTAQSTSSIVPTTAQTPVIANFAQIPVPTAQAKAWMVLDADSGQIIAQHNADERLAPASLTKLLTASLVFQALDEKRLNLDQLVTVSERAWRTGGSRMFIEVNKQVRVADLIQGMIVQSGNDATIQLAQAVSGTVEVFVDQMNKTAQAFGMTNSHFNDPTGLPSENTYTTVRDLSLLAQHIIRDYPQYYHYFSQQSFTFNKITQANRNGLLSRNIGVDGLKTGHTDDAGYCLISTAVRDDRRIIAIVMGTKTIREREQISQQLLDWSYSNFSNVTIAPAGQTLLSPRIYEGQSKNVNLGAKNDVLLTVPRGQEQNVQQLTQLKKDLVAPVSAGEVVGSLQFILNGQVIKQEPLMVLQSVEQAGFFGRMWDKFISLF